MSAHCLLCEAQPGPAVHRNNKKHPSHFKIVPLDPDLPAHSLPRRLSLLHLHLLLGLHLPQWHLLRHLLSAGVGCVHFPRVVSGQLTLCDQVSRRWSLFDLLRVQEGCTASTPLPDDDITLTQYMVCMRLVRPGSGTDRRLTKSPIKDGWSQGQVCFHAVRLACCMQVYI